MQVGEEILRREMRNRSPISLSAMLNNQQRCFQEEGYWVLGIGRISEISQRQFGLSAILERFLPVGVMYKTKTFSSST